MGASTILGSNILALEQLIGERSLAPGDLVMEIHKITMSNATSHTVTCKNINRIMWAKMILGADAAGDLWGTSGIYWSASGAAITFTGDGTETFDAETAYVLAIGTYISTTAPSL